jgi:myo-inositol-1(or 4)-monophosphatase
MNNYTKKLEIAIRAAVAAGNNLSKVADIAPSLNRVKKESFRDIATQADLFAEKETIMTIRQYDNSPILSEEVGAIGDLDGKKDFWVIDPLDGTVNYTNHIPLYATSIAYLAKGIPVVGVIYNPSQNELFYGARGIGVFKNNTRISINDRLPENSLFAMAFSGKKHDTKNRNREFKVFKDVNDKTMGCLRTGSAALNLAYLAEGRLGGCLGKFNKIWDVSAGFIIAELAGASIDFKIDSKEKFLVSYTAAVPLSENFLKKIANR